MQHFYSTIILLKKNYYAHSPHDRIKLILNAEFTAFNLGAALRFQFTSKKLEALYTEEKNAHKYPGVVDDFFEVMAIIDAAVDQRDLYAQKGLRFEKLQGKRGKKGQRSLRLNDQWRLIVVLDEDDLGQYLNIIDIEDYH